MSGHGKRHETYGYFVPKGYTEIKEGLGALLFLVVAVDFWRRGRRIRTAGAARRLG